MLFTLNQLLEPAQAGGYAVVAPDFPSLGFTEFLIERAEKLQAPLILSWAPEIGVGHEINPPARYFKIIRAMAEKAKAPLALHLDHATELIHIKRALDWGFTSVMIDASRKPYQENLELTQTVVELAHSMGVSVESELGVVGSGELDYHNASDRAQLTNPDLAVRFVTETGVDALAVAVGTVHGRYRGEPNLDFELLAELNQRLSVPLVLHGCSGTGDQNITKAIRLGIRKINLFSDMMAALNEALTETLKPDQLPYENIRGAAGQVAAKVLDHYIHLSGSAGKGILPSASPSERAIELFNQGFSCSEAIFRAFASHEGFTSDTAQLVLSMMGGGLSNQGHICGAVLGGLAVLGARSSRVNPLDQPARMKALAEGKDLLDAIKGKYNDLDCVQLTGINFNIPEQAARFEPERVADRACLPMIRLVCELITEKDKIKSS